MPNTNRAPELERAPDPAEILAAHQAGLTVVAYRALQKQEPRRLTKSGSVSKTGVGKQNRPICPSPVEQFVSDVVELVLPWSVLLTDNNRQHWVGTRMMTTKAYKAAKARAVESIKQQMTDADWRDLVGPEWWPLYRTQPVAITVTLIEPNRSAKRDLLNYQKLICDAMSGVVYADDSLIDDAHFTRGMPDIDRPRAEITVRPL